MKRTRDMPHTGTKEVDPVPRMRTFFNMSQSVALNGTPVPMVASVDLGKHIVHDTKAAYVSKVLVPTSATPMILAEEVSEMAVAVGGLGMDGDDPEWNAASGDPEGVGLPAPSMDLMTEYTRAADEYYDSGAPKLSNAGSTSVDDVGWFHLPKQDVFSVQELNGLMNTAMMQAALHRGRRTNRVSYYLEQDILREYQGFHVPHRCLTLPPKPVTPVPGPPFAPPRGATKLFLADRLRLKPLSLFSGFWSPHKNLGDGQMCLNAINFQYTDATSANYGPEFAPSTGSVTVTISAPYSHNHKVETIDNGGSSLAPVPLITAQAQCTLKTLSGSTNLCIDALNITNKTGATANVGYIYGEQVKVTFTPAPLPGKEGSFGFTYTQPNLSSASNPRYMRKRVNQIPILFDNASGKEGSNTKAHVMALLNSTDGLMIDIAQINRRGYAGRWATADDVIFCRKTRGSKVVLPSSHSYPFDVDPADYKQENGGGVYKGGTQGMARWDNVSQNNYDHKQGLANVEPYNPGDGVQSHIFPPPRITQNIKSGDDNGVNVLFEKSRGKWEVPMEMCVKHYAPFVTHTTNTVGGPWQHLQDKELNREGVMLFISPSSYNAGGSTSTTKVVDLVMWDQLIFENGGDPDNSAGTQAILDGTVRWAPQFDMDFHLEASSFIRSPGPIAANGNYTAVKGFNAESKAKYETAFGALTDNKEWSAQGFGMYSRSPDWDDTKWPTQVFSDTIVSASLSGMMPSPTEVPKRVMNPQWPIGGLFTTRSSRTTMEDLLDEFKAGTEITYTDNNNNPIKLVVTYSIQANGSGFYNGRLVSQQLDTTKPSWLWDPDAKKARNQLDSNTIIILFKHSDDAYQQVPGYPEDKCIQRNRDTTIVPNTKPTPPGTGSSTTGYFYENTSDPIANEVMALNVQLTPKDSLATKWMLACRVLENCTDWVPNTDQILTNDLIHEDNNATTTDAYLKRLFQKRGVQTVEESSYDSRSDEKVVNADGGKLTDAKCSIKYYELGVTVSDKSVTYSDASSNDNTVNRASLPSDMKPIEPLIGPQGQVNKVWVLGVRLGMQVPSKNARSADGYPLGDNREFVGGTGYINAATYCVEGLLQPFAATVIDGRQPIKPAVLSDDSGRPMGLGQEIPPPIWGGRRFASVQTVASVPRIRIPEGFLPLPTSLELAVGAGFVQTSSLFVNKSVAVRYGVPLRSGAVAFSGMNLSTTPITITNGVPTESFKKYPGTVSVTPREGWQNPYSSSKDMDKGEEKMVTLALPAKGLDLHDITEIQILSLNRGIDGEISAGGDPTPVAMSLNPSYDDGTANDSVDYQLYEFNGVPSRVYSMAGVGSSELTLGVDALYRNGKRRRMTIPPGGRVLVTFVAMTQFE